MPLSEEEKLFLPRLFLTITREEEEKKLEKALDSFHIPIWYQCRGKGTAPSEMLDIFGLGGTTRLITLGIIPKMRTGELFEALVEKLFIRRRGGGIAITVPLVGLQGAVLQVIKDEAREAIEKRMKERIREDMAEVQSKSEYTVVWVSVTSGFGDDVIDAAREAGARGGTIMKGRRKNSEYVSQHLGISLQEEQEFVMIVTPREKKKAVMSAISEACGLRSKAHGIVIALPVDEAIGLEL